MNFYTDFFIFLFAFAMLSYVLIGLGYLFYRIFTKNKAISLELNFEESLNILKIVINTELDAYENDIFLSKGSITNSNFDNYYNDITKKIISNLSPNLIKNLSLYISEDMIYIIIARAVKKFLTEKITGTI